MDCRALPSEELRCRRRLMTSRLCVSWIRQSAKDVGQVLRDYRNYIHPEKELSHGVTVVAEDTAMFVGVFSSIAEQIIKSA